MYSISFTKSKTRFFFKFSKKNALHFNKENSYLFVNGTEIYKFKAKKYEIKDGEIEICLADISTGYSVDNMKTIGI